MKGNGTRVHQMETPSTHIFRGLKAVESLLFSAANMHYPAAQCLSFVLVLSVNFHGVCGSWLHSVCKSRLLCEETVFKYQKGSLVHLPLGCGNESNLLEIGVGNVDLEQEKGLRLSDLPYVSLSLCPLVSFSCAACTGSDPLMQWSWKLGFTESQTAKSCKEPL